MPRRSSTEPTPVTHAPTRAPPHDGPTKDSKTGVFGHEHLGGLGNGETWMTRTIFWTLLAVTAVVGIGIAIAKSVAADKAQTKALRAQNVRRINPACVSSGHAYKIFD